MSWINIFPYQTASSTHYELYDCVKEPADNMNNFMLLHHIRFEFIVNHFSNSLKILLNAEEIVENIILNLHSHQFCKIFEVKYVKALNNAKLPSLNSLSII